MSENGCRFGQHHVTFVPVRNTAHWKTVQNWGASIIVSRGGNNGGKAWPWPAELTLRQPLANCLPQRHFGQSEQSAASAYATNGFGLSGLTSMVAHLDGRIVCSAYSASYHLTARLGTYTRAGRRDMQLQSEPLSHHCHAYV